MDGSNRWSGWDSASLGGRPNSGGGKRRGKEKSTKKKDGPKDSAQERKEKRKEKEKEKWAWRE